MNEITTVNLSTLETEQTAKNSLDFLAALALPEVYRYAFPPIFLTIWSWLLSYTGEKRTFPQLAIGLPRGFGKTMFLKLYMLYVILFTDKRFVLVICGTQGKAINVLTDVCSMLSSPNIRKVFGYWKIATETDRQDLKRFSFRGRMIILMAAGADSDIRGITLENARPDVIIFDDIQTREDADSPQVSKKLEDWMFGTAMKAKSPEDCIFIFVANMYPTDWSLLKRLKRNPTWLKFIVGGILADGTSLWEDLQPLQQLLKEYQNDSAAGKSEIFHAEVLNDENASVNNLIDISALPHCHYQKGDIHNGSFIVIDPATDKQNADAVSIGYFELYESVPVCREIVEGRLSPGDTIREALKMAMSNNCHFIGIESNAYQYSLLYWFREVCNQLNIQGIHVRELYSGIRAKNVRIVNMFKQLKAGEILVADAALPAVKSQIVAFNPLKGNNTDGVLDLLTYAPKMVELYGPEIVASTTIEVQASQVIEVLSADYNSPF
jgi:hypothetical protein